MNPLRLTARKARSLLRRYHNWRRLSKQAAIDPTKRDVWSIAMYEGDSPLNLHPIEGIRQPALTIADVTDVNASLVADPYLVKTDSVWYLFFEVMNSETNLGQIAVATSSDGRTWHYQRMILEEPFHLSYPCVFDHNGSYFMIPETHQAKAVKLYEAIEFPFKWKFVKNLVEGEVMVDASPFLYAGKWWFFASGGDASRWYSQNLRLFHSNDLMGPWQEHPKSPLIKGNPHHCRPAGRVMCIGGKIIRLAQDCDPTYGRSVRAFEVTRLSETEYAERPVSRKPVLSASATGWNAEGMHHIDALLEEDGKWIACVDGWTWMDR
jgi:hypothetical protein